MTSPETLTMRELFDQGEFWVNKDGYLPIAEMTVLHRRKAAVFLLRKSIHLATLSLSEGDWDIGLSGDYETVDYTAKETLRRIGAPQSWIRETALYQALIKDGADPDAYFAAQDADRT